MRASAALAALAALVLVPCVSAANASDNDLEVGGARVRVEFEHGAFAGGDALIVGWVRRAAGIVAAYYGHFPVRTVTVRVLAQPGMGVHGGKTFANPDAFIRVQAGSDVTSAQLGADWVMVHEMTHLALPDTGEAHAWLSEGLATYVEGVARVQAGDRSEQDVWAEELRSMSRGMPQPGDGGLDHTHSWGRTYWGGAMFCLLADVEIRRRTRLRYGLQDALRAVLDASGGLAADWPIERVLRTGDQAVGTTTLEDLYRQMKDAPVTPDLSALWRQLGVESEGDQVRLDERAPLADVRRAIMHSHS
jgi:hypothetical protein